MKRLKQLTTVGEYHNKLLDILDEEGWYSQTINLQSRISTMSLYELNEYLSFHFGDNETERLLGLVTKELRK